MPECEREECFAEAVCQLGAGFYDGSGALITCVPVALVVCQAHYETAVKEGARALFEEDFLPIQTNIERFHKNLVLFVNVERLPLITEDDAPESEP